MGADTENWERISRHPYLKRKPFPQHWKTLIWCNGVLIRRVWGNNGSSEIVGPGRPADIKMRRLESFRCCCCLRAALIFWSSWVQSLFSDVCTELFGLCNNSVINVPGASIAGELILILCRDVQISLLLLFPSGLLVRNTTHTHMALSKHDTPLLPQSYIRTHTCFLISKRHEHNQGLSCELWGLGLQSEGG